MFSNLDAPEIIVQAVERSSGGGVFVYDLDLLDPNGRVLEQWRGLALRIVASSDAKPVRALGLIGPYLERRLGEIAPQAGIKIAFRGDSSEAESMLKPLTVTYRVDGKPEAYTNGDHRRETFVSAAHSGRFRVAVSGNSAIGCDLERIVPHGDEEWRDLLGPEHFAYWSHLVRESLDSAEIGTRLWSVRESLTKLGMRLPLLLRVSAELPDGWIEFAAQGCRIHTCVIKPDGEPNPFVFAIAH